MGPFYQPPTTGAKHRPPPSSGAQEHALERTDHDALEAAATGISCKLPVRCAVGFSGQPAAPLHAFGEMASVQAPAVQ